MGHWKLMVGQNVLIMFQITGLAWKVGSRVCGRKLKLLHRSGYVTCDNRMPTVKSNWGCHEHPGEGQYDAAHVTVGKGSENSIVPHAGDPKVTLKSNGWYILSGFKPMSPYLEFDLPQDNGNSYYCFEVGTEYHLWYGEDVNDVSEHDNDGTAYTDIYIMS